MTAKKPRQRKATARTGSGAHVGPEPAGSAPDEGKPSNAGEALAEAFLTGERINQVLLGLIEPRVWRIFPPSSSRRSIATTFAHIHNVRCMRLRMSEKSMPPPERLDRSTISIDETRAALAESARAMAALIVRSVLAGGRVHDVQSGVVGLTCAAIVHEAHHRGQICHWMRELGTPLSPEQQLTLWEWDKRWKEVAARRASPASGTR